jgi:hypothetical protein
MSSYKLVIRSSFLRLVRKLRFIIIIGGMMIAFSSLCYGFQWEGIEITPSITSVTEYNDNILYTAVDQVADEINRIEPGLAIHVPGTRSELNLAYTAGFEFFAMHPEFNDITHTATGRVRIQPVEHLIFTCDDTFYRAKDLAQLDLLGLRRQREWYWANTVQPSLEYIFGPDRSLKLNYSNNILDFDNPAIFDSSENKVNGVLTYRITRRGIVTFDYTYTHGEFGSIFDQLDGHDVLLGYEYQLNPRTSILADSRFLLRNFTGPQNTDYIAYNFLLGFRRDLMANLSIEAQGGYLRFDPRAMKAIDNFVGIIKVTYKLEGTTFILSADKGYEEIFAAIEELGYATSWGVNGSLSHTLHRFWRVELTGQYRHRDYEFEPRVDSFWTAGGALVFEPVKWFTAEVRYAHTSLASTVTADNYKVNSVMLTLQFRY